MISIIRQGLGIAFKQARLAVSGVTASVTGKSLSSTAKASMASKWQRHGQQAADVVMAVTGIAGVYYVADTATRWISGAETSVSAAASKLDDYAKMSVMIAAGLAALYIITRKR